MAKSREQMIQEQLGAMAFQIAVLAADNEALREENEALKAAQKPEGAHLKAV